VGADQCVIRLGVQVQDFEMKALQALRQSILKFDKTAVTVSDCVMADAAVSLVSATLHFSLAQSTYQKQECHFQFGGARGTEVLLFTQRE
jgi:hypothetical protein